MNDTIRLLYVAGRHPVGTGVPDALEETDMAVCHAEGGLDALRCLAAESVDCVVCDGPPTHLTVESFVSRVRSGPSPPVLVYLDEPGSERAIDAMQAGAAEFVSPGVNTTRDVYETVREAVADARAKRGRRDRRRGRRHR